MIIYTYYRIIFIVYIAKLYQLSALMTRLQCELTHTLFSMFLVSRMTLTSVRASGVIADLVCIAGV